MIKILLLSIDHRIYKGEFYLAKSLSDGTQSLKTLGFKTGGPVGTKPPFFVLLLEHQIPGEAAGSSYKDPDWHELTTIINKNIEIYDTYRQLMLGGYQPETKNFDVFYFGSGPQMAAKLAHLVVKGQKRGTAGWAKTQKKTNSFIPQIGGTSLVTDGYGIPLCFIKTISINLIKFKDVTDQMARIEGEGDLTLADWKKGHKHFWETYDSIEINETFTEDELIFFETFEVTKILGNSTNY